MRMTIVVATKREPIRSGCECCACPHWKVCTGSPEHARRREYEIVSPTNDACRLNPVSGASTVRRELGLGNPTTTHYTANELVERIACPVEDAILRRLGAAHGDVLARRRQPQAEELPHGGRAAGHAVLEAKIVDCGQFIGRQHDLQS